MTYNIVSFLGIVVCSILSVIIGTSVLHYDVGMVSVFTLFATWFAFIVSNAEYWPFGKVKQPVKGLIFVAVCLGYAVIHLLTQDKIFGFSADYYWPFIANLFLGIGITTAFDNRLVAGLKQPVAVIANILVWYLLTAALFVLVPVYNGMVPAVWFAWFVFYLFWMEKWPIAELPLPQRGIITMFVLAALGALLAYIFVWFFKTSFFSPDAGTWFAQWVWWLVFTSWVMGTRPFQNLKQPAKGLAGLALTVALASVTYAISSRIFPDLGYLNSLTWIFVSWVYIWPLCFQTWPSSSGGTPAE